MGGSVKRSPEVLAARAKALQAVADEIEEPKRRHGLLDRHLDEAAQDEVRRVKAMLRRRSEQLWAESGKRHMERLTNQQSNAR